MSEPTQALLDPTKPVKNVDEINAAVAAAPDVPQVLLPYQQRWVADRSPLKVCEKGRRTGITWAEAADDVLIAASERAAGGMNVYYFPQAKEDAVEYIETAAKWAKAFHHGASQIAEDTWENETGEVFAAADPDKFIKTYVIRFASGFRIVALSSAPARARGKQGVFVLDEAAFHPNLPGVLKAVMASFLRGGCIRVISTHDGEDNPFNELIAEIRAKRRLGTVHTYPFRLAVEEGMYRRICFVEGKQWSPEAEAEYVAQAYGLYGEDAGEELDAIPKSGSGVFLSTVMIERCMRPGKVVRIGFPDSFAALPDNVRESEMQAILDEEVGPLLAALDRNLDHHYGSDFARSVDLSVIDPVAVGADLKRRVPWQLEMRNVPFRQQEQALFYLVDRLPNFRSGAMDARGNGQALAEYAVQRYGSRVEAVMLSTEWYRDNAPSFRAAFEDQTIELVRDADTRNDLRQIKKVNGIAKVPEDARTTGTDGKPRHGDSAVALWLAWYATQRDVAPIEFTAAPPRARSWESRDEDESLDRLRRLNTGTYGGRW